MSDPVFITARAPLALSEVCALAGVAPPADAPDRLVRGVAPLDRAGPDDLSFLEGARHVPQFRASRAGICLATARFAPLAPATMTVLTAPRPYAAFVAVARRLFAETLRPGSVFGHHGVAAGAFVHPQARLEEDVTVDPGAAIGPGAEVGTGTVVAAGAIIGPGVRIGRDCAIGAGASVFNAVVGDRVILHPGVRIGQDGFGYLGGAKGHAKVPQLCRVVLQDDVEVGANTTIDRGGLRDTVIGEGTKIDNLVQIAHNVSIGRHCVVVAQTGIAGSATLGDYVVLGGQVGVIGHVSIGAGSQIAATSNVKDDVPPGVQWGGSPAKPMRDWFREVMAVQRLARDPRGTDTKGPGD